MENRRGGGGEGWGGGGGGELIGSNKYNRRLRGERWYFGIFLKSAYGDFCKHARTHAHTHTHTHTLMHTIPIYR